MSQRAEIVITYEDVHMIEFTLNGDEFKYIKAYGNELWMGHGHDQECIEDFFLSDFGVGLPFEYCSDLVFITAVVDALLQWRANYEAARA